MHVYCHLPPPTAHVGSDGPPQDLVAPPPRSNRPPAPLEYGPVRRGSAEDFWLNVRLGSRRRS